MDSLEAGSIAAAEVISHFGARPEADLQAAGRAVKNLDQLAVYCGSAPGSDPAFADAAQGDRRGDGPPEESSSSTAAAGSG